MPALSCRCVSAAACTTSLYELLFLADSVRFLTSDWVKSHLVGRNRSESHGYEPLGRWGRERLPALRSTLRHPAPLTLAPGSAETRCSLLALLAPARCFPPPPQLRHQRFLSSTREVSPPPFPLLVLFGEQPFSIMKRHDGFTRVSRYLPTPDDSAMSSGQKGAPSSSPRRRNLEESIWNSYPFFIPA